MQSQQKLQPNTSQVKNLMEQLYSTPRYEKRKSQNTYNLTQLEEILINSENDGENNKNDNKTISDNDDGNTIKIKNGNKLKKEKEKDKEKEKEKEKEIQNNDKEGNDNYETKSKNRRWATLKFKTMKPKNIYEDFSNIDINIKELNNSKLLSTEISKINLLIIFEIIESFNKEISKEDLKQPDNIINNSFQTIYLLFKNNQSDQFTKILIKRFRYFVHYFKNNIFKQNNQWLTNFCTQIYLLTIYKNKNIRRLSNTFLYLLFILNYESTLDLNKIEISMIISLKNYIDKYNIEKYFNIFSMHEDYHKNTFESWKFLALQDRKIHPAFYNHVMGLINTLDSILLNIKKIHLCCFDPLLQIDLQLNLANKYKNVPHLRLAFLESINQYHQKENNHAEGGIIQLHIAAIISEYFYYINKKKKMMKKEQVGDQEDDGDNGEKIMDNDNNTTTTNNKKKKKKKKKRVHLKGAKSFKNISKSTLEECYNNRIPNLDYISKEFFSQENLISYLQIATTNFQNAKLWNKVCEICHAINIIFENTDNFKNLSKTHNTLRAAYEYLIQENCFYKSEKILWSYFRVAFYGEAFNEINGNEYVYKIHPNKMISEIGKEIKNNYQEKYKQNIEILNNKNDSTILNKDKLYILVHRVFPYFPKNKNKNYDNDDDSGGGGGGGGNDTQKEERVFNWQLINNVNYFSYDYISSNNDQGDNLTNVNEKKTFSIRNIFKVEHKFPYLTNRQKIIKHTKSNISPIEFYIQMLLDRKKLIKIELSKLSPYSNKMQQLLSGTLLPQVNEGIIKIADQFLSAKNIIFHNKLHINKLKIAFNKLLDTCEIAIQNTKFKVKMEQIQLHQAISHGLHMTKKKLYPYLTGKTIKKDDQGFKISKIVSKIQFDKNVIGNFKD